MINAAEQNLGEDAVFKAVGFNVLSHSSSVSLIREESPPPLT
jgi:hypothetical protein